MQNKILFNVLFSCMNLSFICGLKFHDHLTDEEIYSNFKLPHNEVPEHDTVSVADNLHVEGSNSKVSSDNFGQMYNFNLEQNSFLIGTNTPIYLAYNDGYRGVIYRQVPHDSSMRTFSDYQNNLLITQKRSGRNVNMYGTFGNGLKMQSIDSTIGNKVRELQKSNSYGWRNSNSNNTFNQFTDKKALNNFLPDDMNQTSSYVVDTDSEMKKSNFERTVALKAKRIRTRRKRGIVNAVYPEILVTVDNGYVRQHNNDYKEVVKHMVVLWNDIDTRFKNVQYPQIRLNIAGIIIPMNSGAAPYFERNTFGYGKISGVSTLNSLTEYFKTNTYFQNKNFDIVFALTTLDIQDGPQDIAGRANMHATCGVNTVGLAEITARRPVNTIVHELAHIFGADHDGVGTSASCTQQGYIMDPITPITGFNFFSTCSQRSFQIYFANPSNQCYFNQPHVQNPYPVAFLGTLISLDEQCDKVYPGFRPRNIDESVCYSLICVKVGYAPASRLVAHNGSPCGPNKICYNQQCVNKWW